MFKRKQKDNPKERRYTTEAILLVILVLSAAWFYYDKFILVLPEASAENARGTFGDSFGAFTSIVTGVTLVLIWISIRQTQDELRSNRVDRETQLEIADKHVFSASMDSVVKALEVEILGTAPSTTYLMERGVRRAYDVNDQTRQYVLSSHHDLVLMGPFRDLVLSKNYEEITSKVAPLIMRVLKEEAKFTEETITDTLPRMLENIRKYLEAVELRNEIDEVRRMHIKEYVKKSLARKDENGAGVQDKKQAV